VRGRGLFIILALAFLALVGVGLVMGDVADIGFTGRTL
jgi:hypothetical protein